jgi:hypothetical protein
MVCRSGINEVENPLGHAPEYGRFLKKIDEIPAAKLPRAGFAKVLGQDNFRGKLLEKSVCSAPPTHLRLL